MFKLIDHWVLSQFEPQYEGTRNLLQVMGAPGKLQPGRSWQVEYDYQTDDNQSGHFKGRVAYHKDESYLTLQHDDSNGNYWSLEFYNARDEKWHMMGCEGKSMATMDRVERIVGSDDVLREALQESRSRFRQNGIVTANRREIYDSVGFWDKTDRFMKALLP